jgi:tripeptidyl-peptidase-1
VISTSYGDDEQTVPLSYATSVCNGFAQLGARGISLLFSSGDNGVGPANDCFSNNGTNATTFLPAFPASCVSPCSKYYETIQLTLSPKPYVTVVGATMKMNPEVVAHNPSNDFSSGGGFSNYFSRPSYQDDVVPAYIDSLHNQFSGLFNTSGRGYPDIAAQGYHYLTIWNGTTTIIDGTRYARL